MKSILFILSITFLSCQASYTEQEDKQEVQEIAATRPLVSIDSAYSYQQLTDSFAAMRNRVAWLSSNDRTLAVVQAGTQRLVRLMQWARTADSLRTDSLLFMVDSLTNLIVTRSLTVDTVKWFRIVDGRLYGKEAIRNDTIFSSPGIPQQ